MKTPKFPVAMFRKEDGIPAVWLTFTNWMAIKNGLVREYLCQRELIAKRDARKAAGKPESRDGWGTHFETTARDAALELYQVGYEAHRSIHERSGSHDLTPERLVELGDKCERRAFDQEAQRLAEGKELCEQARA